MSRDFALLAIIIVAVVLAILVSSEHRPSGYAMPLLIDSSVPVQAPMLFSPCPVSRRNFPIPQERKA